MVKKKSFLSASIICTLATVFYLYELILQVSPAVMTHELMHDLGLNAATLGIMAAFYYYAYTAMQLPAGLLYDRFGSRRLLTLAILICAIGALLFSLSVNIAVASIGRLLMGIGSAFAFIGALLLVSRWFPPHYFTAVAGLVQLMGALGAIIGQVPLALAIGQWGWHPTFLALAVIGGILALFVWIIVRDSPAEVAANKKPSKAIEQHSALQQLKQVCGNRQTWLTALYSFTVWAPITAFTALWGIPFLTTTYQMSTAAASTACAMTWLGVALGSPLFGCWSDKIALRCIPLTVTAVLGIVGLFAIIYIPKLPVFWLYSALFIFGLAASGQSIAFGLVKDNNNPKVAGTAIGFNNMATVVGGALFQPIVGSLLELSWQGTVQGNIHIYDVNAYHIAFTILPLCYVVAAVTSQFFIKETRCQRQDNAYYIYG